MSNTWNEGYFTDAAYTYGYYREISPFFQRFCLLLRGIAAPLSAEPIHCELGFGQGVSVNIHAAANPGTYIGTDFNPEHATHASGLATASGCNAQLLDDSFDELLGRKDLPQFDSISLHGIWTWVSRDNQKVITELARRHLKPGGVFYISYNCFPGWAPAYPLRQLFALHDRLASTTEGVTNRVDAALNFTERLLTANPICAAALPSLNDRFNKIKAQDRHYLAHEYLNRDWNLMYFMEVNDVLTPAKLDYATSAAPIDSLDIINLKAEGIAFLATIENPILREQVKDYFTNQQFRKDIFVRGILRLRPAEQRQKLLNSCFVLLQDVSLVPMKVQGALGEANLQEQIYQPIIHALAGKRHTPVSLRDVLSALPGMNYGQVLQAIIVLVSMGAVAPCQDDSAVKQVKKRCDALNLHICERAQFSSAIGYLASPITGTGIGVSRIDQLFVLAKLREHIDPARFVWETLLAAGETLTIAGEAIQGADANIAEIGARLKSFNEKVLPVLKAVGIS